jgi:hypothetical protein
MIWNVQRNSLRQGISQGILKKVCASHGSFAPCTAASCGPLPQAFARGRKTQGVGSLGIGALHGELQMYSQIPSVREFLREFLK